MGCDFADVDGDLAPDLIVTNLAMEANALYVNDGRGRFDDQAFARGVGRVSVIDFGWGVRFFDFEHDGDADCLVLNGHLHAGVTQHDASQEHAQRAKLLLNDGRGHFAVAGAEGGPFVEQKIVGRGLITADFDRDGDLDLAYNANDQAAGLVRRAGVPARRWIGLELRDAGRNPDAIGARVEIEAAGRKQRLEVRGAASFASWNDLALLFGLDSSPRADRVLVRWPRGELEEFGPLDAGRYHTLRRGTGRPPD
jgi:hypothetical protein